MVVDPTIARRSRRRPHLPATARERGRDLAALVGCLLLCAIALAGAFAARGLVSSAVSVERSPVTSEPDDVGPGADLRASEAAGG